MSLGKCQASLTLGRNATFVLHALLFDFSVGLIKKKKAAASLGAGARQGGGAASEGRP